MTDELSYGNKHQALNWSCSFLEVKTDKVAGEQNFFVCHVNVSDITKMADELSKSVMDDSWIMNLDEGARRAYQITVAETAECLVDIFKNNLFTGDKVSVEFGEIMVSMGSSQALEIIFDHTSLPISELWKAQIKGNEGFDFHTVCSDQLINFGEAKFSGSQTPHGKASNQANGFIEKDKHFRDRVHLVNLVEQEAIENLDKEEFGAVLAFSMNAQNPLTVFRNAISTALTHQNLIKAKNIYIVGVSHDS